MVVSQKGIFHRGQPPCPSEVGGVLAATGREREGKGGPAHTVRRLSGVYATLTAGLCYSGRTPLWGRAFDRSHSQEGRMVRKGCSPSPDCGSNRDT